MSAATRRIVVLHAVLIGVLFALQFVLPAYHHTNLARIMVLATFAMGYNLLLGYTGLMSLGHAMFFAAGMYATGLTIYHLEWTTFAAVMLGVGCGALFAALFGLFALRTSGVSFLIVTMMFGQACYLSILYFNEVTLGDQGFSIGSSLAPLRFGGAEFEFSDPAVKFNGAWLVFSVSLIICVIIAASPFGRVLKAVRENEARAQLLGYSTYRYKLFVLTVSGAMAGAAGAAYAVLFSYVGASFAAILHSIYPLLWTLLGGAGTTIGPFVGTGVMFYMIDITSGWTSAWLLVVGVSLLALVLWFPQGLIGALRDRMFKWLP